MKNNAFPRQVANLITEDPDIPQDDQRRGPSWKYEDQLEIEELEDAEILGEQIYFVKITVGLNHSPGEAMVMYDRDGGGYPGSPDEIEWDILSIDEAEAIGQNGEEVAIELSEELKEKLKNALYKHLDDETVSDAFESSISAGADDGDERYDDMRDRQRDEPDDY